MIVVSHNIEHVFRIATRIVALRQGRVTDLKRKESTPDEVVGFITGSRGVSVNGA